MSSYSYYDNVLRSMSIVSIADDRSIYIDDINMEDYGHYKGIEALPRHDGVESNGPQPQQPHVHVFLYGWQLYTVQFSLFLGLILSIMDSSSVSTALVTIGDQFNDFIRIQWVVLAYMITYLGFALVFSRMSDVIGRKWATVTAVVLLGAFSVGCGCAQTMDQLIIFRALQGIGGAGLYSMALIVLPEVTPREKIPLMSGLIGGVTVIAAVLGPVLGGIITTHSTWRWVFWFNIPACGFILILLVVFCPDFKYAGRISWRQFDWTGCFVYLAACTLLVTALQEGGAGSIGWDSAPFVACILMASVAFIGFGCWIVYFSRGTHTIIPLFQERIIAHRIMGCTIAVSVLVGFVFYAVLVQLPERFQIVNGDSAQMSGVALLALSGPSAIGSTLGGALSVKKNNTFYTLSGGVGLIILGNGAMHTISDSTKVPTSTYGFEVIMGLGFGLVFSTSTVLMKLHAIPQDGASAQGLMSQGRLLGGNIGLAVATIVQNKQIIKSLTGYVDSAMITNIRHSLLAISDLSLENQGRVVQAFADSFRSMLVINMIVGGVAFLFALGIWEKNPITFQEVIQRAIAAEAAARTGAPPEKPSNDNKV